MTTIRNEVRKGTYLDSVALMRMSRSVAVMDGVIECGMMMATPANKRIMADAAVLGPEGHAAGPGDLVIAVSAHTAAAADAALAAARAQIDAPKTAGAGAAAWAPRTIRAAVQADPAANLALISVPGAFAAAEGRKAISRGLNVMMFSDNVPIADEVALKQLARERGLLMMGPDCGTAIINGTPLGFANVVPRGDIGIIGASGTGIQEVSCLIANNGGGISHAIGTGGRDLKAEVGGITTLMAIDLLDADPATRHIVIISKPPADEVAAKVLERVKRSKKTFTVCFLGVSSSSQMPANAAIAPTLKVAAEAALGRTLAPVPLTHGAFSPRGRLIRGLFAGGTLCAEAQHVLIAAGLTPLSNTPIPGAKHGTHGKGAHVMIDLGDDEFTQGRPHPMIEPAVRDAALAEAINDPDIGVLLLDIVLGTGAHGDPAGHLARTWSKVVAVSHHKPPLIVASVTGTRGDIQGWQDQFDKLSSIAVVCGSNADAAAAAATFVTLR
jgi:FdrA protein